MRKDCRLRVGTDELEKRAVRIFDLRLCTEPGRNYGAVKARASLVLILTMTTGITSQSFFLCSSFGNPWMGNVGLNCTLRYTAMRMICMSRHGRRTLHASTADIKRKMVYHRLGMFFTWMNNSPKLSIQVVGSRREAWVSVPTCTLCSVYPLLGVSCTSSKSALLLFFLNINLCCYKQSLRITEVSPAAALAGPGQDDFIRPDVPHHCSPHIICFTCFLLFSMNLFYN